MADQFTKSEQVAQSEPMAGQHEYVPLDIDDPHRAALEDNPEHAERPTFNTLAAVVVSIPVYFLRRVDDFPANS